MLTYFTEAFGSDLTQQALQAGLLAAITMALVGSWVVVRGLAFTGDALAHGVLPGLALAVIWGFSLNLGALVSAIVMMVGVTLARRTGRLSDDAAIGLLFVGMLALGVIIISRGDAYAGDLTALLFGSPLAVSADDLQLQVLVAVGVLIAIVLLYRRLMALSFDPRKAAVLGQRPNLTHAVLLSLVAVAIVASFQIVGTLLVMGLMIAPAATALLIVHRMPLVMAASVGIGCLSVVLGFTLSYHNDTAPSATVAGVAVMIFFVIALVRGLVEGLGRHLRPQ